MMKFLSNGMMQRAIGVFNIYRVAYAMPDGFIVSPLNDEKFITTKQQNKTINHNIH
jgi:hypothetical protein